MEDSLQEGAKEWGWVEGPVATSNADMRRPQQNLQNVCEKPVKFWGIIETLLYHEFHTLLSFVTVHPVQRGGV